MVPSVQPGQNGGDQLPPLHPPPSHLTHGLGLHVARSARVSENGLSKASSFTAVVGHRVARVPCCFRQGLWNSGSAK